MCHCFLKQHCVLQFSHCLWNSRTHDRDGVPCQQTQCTWLSCSCMSCLLVQPGHLCKNPTGLKPTLNTPTSASCPAASLICSGGASQKSKEVMRLHCVSLRCDGAERVERSGCAASSSVNSLQLNWEHWEVKKNWKQMGTRTKPSSFFSVCD